MRSTLLTLAGGDPMPAAAISKLLSMRTGQGYAEFAVSSFGTDGAIGDPEQPQGKWAEYPAGQPGDDDLRRHVGSAAQHHRRAAARTASRSVETSISGYYKLLFGYAFSSLPPPPQPPLMTNDVEKR